MALIPVIGTKGYLLTMALRRHSQRHVAAFEGGALTRDNAMTRVTVNLAFSGWVMLRVVGLAASALWLASVAMYALSVLSHVEFSQMLTTGLDVLSNLVLAWFLFLLSRNFRSEARLLKVLGYISGLLLLSAVALGLLVVQLRLPIFMDPLSVIWATFFLVLAALFLVLSTRLSGLTRAVGMAAAIASAIHGASRFPGIIEVELDSSIGYYVSFAALFLIGSFVFLLALRVKR